MNKESLDESLVGLEQALNAGGSLRTKDLTALAAPYLKSDAALVLRNVQSQAAVESDMEIETMYLGVRVRLDDVESGVKLIAQDLNILAKEELAVSVMTGITQVDLADEIGHDPSCVVMAIVNVRRDRPEAAHLVQYAMTGDMTNVRMLDNVKTVLGENEFTAIVRVTMAFSLLGASKLAGVHEMVAEYLRVLPAGTKLVSVQEKAIGDLSVPFEVRFHNPLLGQVKRVELIHVRQHAMVSDKLEEYNLLLGVRYYDKSGKALFPEYV